MPRVSPLKARVFDTCRLRFRYQYVDKLPARLRPSDTAGSLLHRVLCDFFSKVPKDERTAQKLISMYEEGWDALSLRYRRLPGVDEFRRSGLDQLRRFAQQNDLQAQPFMVEPYFQVEIAPGVVLFGRVDRIDAEPDGSLHIIDYKTGAQPGDVDAGQLRLYAIMVEEKLARNVSRGSFWYLDDGTVWTAELSAEEKERARQTLLNSVREMEAASEFPPTIAPHCGSCPYLYTCQFREEVQARRQREGW
jgi:putative RecB family exonuclease